MTTCNDLLRAAYAILCNVRAETEIDMPELYDLSSAWCHEYKLYRQDHAAATHPINDNSTK